MAVFNTAFAIDMTRLQFFASVDEALDCSCSYPETQRRRYGHLTVGRRV